MNDEVTKAQLKWIAEKVDRMDAKLDRLAERFNLNLGKMLGASAVIAVVASILIDLFCFYAHAGYAPWGWNGWLPSVSSSADLPSGSILQGSVIADYGNEELYMYVGSSWVEISGGGGSYTFADSLVNNSGTVTLVNDSASPGDSQYYGTNSGGTLGYYSLPSSTGTVTSVSVTSANGFAGTVANATTTPAITIETSITGLLHGNGTAVAAETVSSPLLESSGTLSCQTASGSQNGCLDSTDWTTFNSKQTVLTFDAPLVDSSNTVTCNVASGSQAGCLSSTDWTTFNNKQAAGSYITALTGDVTASGPGSASTTIASIQGTAVSGTTGTGDVVFSSSPSLISPNLGIPSAVTLTNATGLPLTTGVTGVLPYSNGGTNNSSAYTQGSVIFAGASGLSQDNDNLFWDDTNDRFYIGGNPTIIGGSPDAQLFIYSTGGSDSSINIYSESSNNSLEMQNQSAFAIEMATSSNTSTEGSVINHERARGTIATKSQMLSGDTFGGETYQGYTGSAFNTGYGAAIEAVATENITNTNSGGELLFLTSPNGTDALGNTNLILGQDDSATFGGKVIVPTFQLTTTPTAGYVLTSDASGNGTWQASSSSGTVTSVSVVSANGFAGTVANATTTPAITLQATNSGIQYSNGTALSAATFPDSVTQSSGAISLVGDSSSPGDSYYYGTNSGGTKGWYASPAANTCPAGSSGQVQYNSSSSCAGSSGMTYDGSGDLTLSGQINATTANLSNLTASEIIESDASKNLISASSLSTALGGLGGNFGSSTGALSISSGTVSAGTLGVGNGGTGITTTPSDGEIPIGNGSDYTATTLTAGSGITVTNGTGSITIAQPYPLPSPSPSGDVVVSTGAGYALGTPADYGAPVVAVYYKSSAGSVSAHVAVNYDTQVVDTGCSGSCVTTGASDWVFTCPVTGNYHVSANSQTSTGAAGIYVVVNGTGYNYIGGVAAAGSIYGGSIDVPCTATNTIAVMPDTTQTFTGTSTESGGTVSSTNVSIHLIK